MKQKFKWLLALVAMVASVNLNADTKTDIMFAKGFGGYTTNSYSAAGTDKSAVANSTNATGVTYAMQVFNGSTGAVRGNQSTATSNFNCRNTTTKDGYYISQVQLTVSGGTIDGSTNNRSVVYFGSSAFTTSPTGTATTASPAKSGQTTLTWTNTDQTVSYFILYNLKTSGTALSAASTTALKVTWTQAVSEKTNVSLSVGANGSLKAYSNEACTSEITISNNKISVDQNSTVYFKATPNTGYVVDSWTGATVNPSDNTKASLAVGTTEATVSVSFKATPSAESYTVQYNLDGGTYGTNHPTSAEIGTAFAVSPPTKANHTFTGWQVTSGLNTSTAKWGPGSALVTGPITSSTQKCIINTTNDIYFKDLGANGASVTLTATWEENTKYTITFADNLQHTASIPNTTDNKIVVYENEIFTFPTISDKTAATSGTCEQIHYHFMGWVLSTHEGTIAAGDIKTGTSAAVTDAATYYAVWAKEEL